MRVITGMAAAGSSPLALAVIRDRVGPWQDSSVAITIFFACGDPPPMAAPSLPVIARRRTDWHGGVHLAPPITAIAFGA